MTYFPSALVRLFPSQTLVSPSTSRYEHILQSFIRLRRQLTTHNPMHVAITHELEPTIRPLTAWRNTAVRECKGFASLALQLVGISASQAVKSAVSEGLARRKVGGWVV